MTLPPVYDILSHGGWRQVKMYPTPPREAGGVPGPFRMIKEDTAPKGAEMADGCVNNQLGLYIHIPFCRRKCGYCDFYSLAEAESAVLGEYRDALLLHLRESAPFAEGYTVNTVYFGGGTPLLLGNARIAAILREVEKRFRLSSNTEITLEANPESVTLKEYKKIRKAGVNRLSLGVQSLDDRQLARLGRGHTAAEARCAYDEARRAGFDNISLDLIYGLPEQTPEQWRDTLREILAWDPEHLSCYNLKLEPGTPLHGENPALPDENAQADMYLDMVRILEEGGLAQYEISNFAKPARLSRHNEKYWRLEPYMGFGPAAHSDFSERRYSFVRDLRQYIDGVKNSDEIVEEMELCPRRDRAGEYIMLGLRTTRGLSAGEYTRLFQASFDPVEKRLEYFQGKGFAVREGDRWRLTPKGFLLSNQIIGDLLEQGAGSFA